MASRRVRIKGIANIPQRKRPQESQPNEINTTEIVKPIINLIPEGLNTIHPSPTPQHEEDPATYNFNDRHEQNEPINLKINNLEQNAIVFYNVHNHISPQINVNNKEPDVTFKSESNDFSSNNSVLSNKSIIGTENREDVPSADKLKIEKTSTVDKICVQSVIMIAKDDEVNVNTKTISKPNLTRRFIKPKLSFNAIKKNTRNNENSKQVPDNINDTQPNYLKVTKEESEHTVNNNSTNNNDDEIISNNLVSCEEMIFNKITCDKETISNNDNSPAKTINHNEIISDPENIKSNDFMSENKIVSKNNNDNLTDIHKNLYEFFKTDSDLNKCIDDKSNTDSIDNNSSENNFVKRRNFVKPTVSIKAFNRTKIKNIDENNLKEKEVNLDEIILPKENGECILSSPNVLGITKLPTFNCIDSTKAGSDTEYSPIVSSPSKFVNRARIKAIPRLGQRRTSFSIGSASESEDDSRRSYRVRNDSVSSSATVSNEVAESPFAIKNDGKKEFNMVIQRKCKRTEQSRKLAEARRDFQRKFNNGKPDRQRLTMMDLIFYNPITAPMSQKKKRTESESTSIPPVDNPPEDPTPESAPVSDEENLIPAPQIKIGPNGEITIDEKSLVVENEKLKKNREALKNTEIIDGDFDTNYGIYKRKKRSKDWSKEETLLFYKALNTIGSDFTLMCELFPHRDRKELKMKFKKEERINRALIDRAVMQPIHFDLTELRREVEIARIQREELEKISKEKGEKTVVKPHRRGSMGAYISTPNMNETQVRKPIKRKRISNTKPKKSILHAGIKSILNKSETSDSEDDKPLLKRFQTRSGRISKPAEKFEAKTDNIKINDNEGNGVKEVIKPGSLMILTETDETGKPIYNIYTIDKDGKKIKIDLNDDILKNLTQNEILNPEEDKANESNSAEISIGVNLTDLSNADIILNGDSMIIPFEEFDTEIMLENEKTLE